jgi:hypothetical protein
VSWLIQITGFSHGPSLADVPDNEQSAVEHKTLDGLHRPSSDPEDQKPSSTENVDNTDKLTGIKLILMLISLTLACFLILLDSLVVATLRNAIRMSSLRPSQKSPTVQLTP